MVRFPQDLVDKFRLERNLGDANVTLGQQVKNLEQSGTFQRYALNESECTARGLASYVVAEQNQTSPNNVWVSLTQMKSLHRN